MTNDREELERKALSARSAEELAAILKEAGEEIRPEDAAELFERVKAQKEELSLDELEAVAGGEEWGNMVWIRDYETEGCAATVEPGSSCWGTDGGCWVGNRSYTNKPIDKKCPSCGVYCFQSGPNYAKCPKCRNGFYI